MTVEPNNGEHPASNSEAGWPFRAKRLAVMASTAFLMLVSFTLPWKQFQERQPLRKGAPAVKDAICCFY